MGDLIVTCTSIHSRNWRCGDQIGKGVPLPTILENMGMVVEGVETCKAVYALAQEKNIEMPITTAVIMFYIKDMMFREEIPTPNGS